MKRKKVFKLTEKELKNIIMESIKEYVNKNDLTISLINKLNMMPKETLDEMFVRQQIFRFQPIGFGSPLFLSHRLNINENVNESVPLETVRKEILYSYNLQPWQFEIRKHENNIKVGIVIPAIEEFPEKIEKDMKTMGYFKSKEEIYVLNNRKYNIMQFEPLFQPNVRDNGKIDGVLMHVTPSSNIDNIKKYGLIPSSKNTEFYYPNRVYFLLNGFTISEIRRIAKGLKLTSGSKDDYSLLIINMFKIPNEVELHYDPNMPNSVYTEKTVPSSAIEKIIPLKIC